LMKEKDSKVRGVLSIKLNEAKKKKKDIRGQWALVFGIAGKKVDEEKNENGVKAIIVTDEGKLLNDLMKTIDRKNSKREEVKKTKTELDRAKNDLKAREGDECEPAGVVLELRSGDDVVLHSRKVQFCFKSKEPRTSGKTAEKPSAEVEE